MNDILTETKSNFENQLKEVDAKIVSVQAELEKLKEYKLKLVGGIETLELISSQESKEEMPQES